MMDQFFKLVSLTNTTLGGVGNEEQPFAARFDFEGVLLSYDAQPPTPSALYHHGDEPHRAGYTVSELLILSQFNVLVSSLFHLQGPSS